MFAGVRLMVATVLGAAVLTPTAVSADEPARVLIVGDSVTHGLPGDYTWRSFAWDGLLQTGASVDFVGPHVGTNAEGDMFGGHYADPSFDTDHAARWGLSMWETLYWNSDTAPSVASLMSSDPDVVVEQLGVNDLTWLDQTAAEMTAHTREFVSRVRAANPQADVVLGTLPQVWFDRVPSYNASLPALAAELSTPESRIVVTPVAAFTNGVDTYDDAHPTTRGQVKIAAAVSEALEELGLGTSVTMPLPDHPGPNDPVRPTPQPEGVNPAPLQPPAAVVPPPAPVAELVAPSAPRRVRAVIDDRRTVVTWNRAARASRYAVKCSTTGKSVRRSTARKSAVLRVRADRCRVRAVNEAGASPWRVVRVRR